MSCCGEQEIDMNSIEEQDSEVEFYANKETKSKERFDICQSCSELKALNICSQCGCFMNIKTRIFWAKCPLGKW